MGIIQERLAEVESKALNRGFGSSIDTACVMQMVSYVAGEPWSDHPECACPVLTSVAIRINDAVDDEHRQLLKPLISKLVGTRGTDEDRRARANFIIWRTCSVTMPILTDLLGMEDLSAELRALTNDEPGFVKAQKLFNDNEEAMWKAVKGEYNTSTASIMADIRRAATAAVTAADVYAADAKAAASHAAANATNAASAAAWHAFATAVAAADAAYSYAYTAGYAGAARDRSAYIEIWKSRIETLRLACDYPKENQ